MRTKKPCKYPNALKEYRLKKKLTQSEVIKMINLTGSENRLSRWENGLAKPSVVNFLKLCKIYEVAPEAIYSNLNFCQKTA